MELSDNTVFRSFHFHLPAALESRSFHGWRIALKGKEPGLYLFVL